MKLVKPNLPGRPKDQEKRTALVQAAAKLFCQNGYDATSLDQIAQTAGVSKLTVYSHFGDKEGLFHAAVAARCEASLPHKLFELDAKMSFPDALRKIGTAFVDLVFAEDVIQLYRVLITQGGQNARLAHLFFETGPKRTIQEFVDLLKAAQQRGLIQVEDTQYAAECFFVLLKGLAHIRVLLGYGDIPSPKQRKQKVERAVQSFLRLILDTKGITHKK